MFIGHYAVGLASKEFAPRTSMGALIAAPILLDLLWPIFLLLGWEHVSIAPNNNPFLRLQFDSYPISHGLVAVLGWATLYASVYFGFTRYIAGSIVIWIGVVSHWVMDFIVHRADLPLDARSRLVGLGVWNHRWLAIAIRSLRSPDQGAHTRRRLIKLMTATNRAAPMIDQMIGNRIPATGNASSSGSPSFPASQLPSNAPINPSAIETKHPPCE